MKHNRAAPTGRPDTIPARGGVNPPLRILVVDDDDAVRQLSTEVLIQFGYQVDAAEDGEAAWDALQVNGYDLLVTDNQMPKVTGLELLQKIRDSDRVIPAIMATGTSPEAEFARRPWLLPAAVLLKPFTPDELLKTVKNILSGPEIHNPNDPSFHL